MSGRDLISRSRTDLVAIRIDGRHPDDRLLMTGAVGIEVSGQEHPPGVVEGDNAFRTAVAVAEGQRQHHMSCACPESLAGLLSRT